MWQRLDRGTVSCAFPQLLVLHANRHPRLLALIAVDVEEVRVYNRVQAITDCELHNTVIIQGFGTKTSLSSGQRFSNLRSAPNTARSPASKLP